MANTSMSPALMELVAERFRVLGEPARLGILHALRHGELTVSDLVEQTGLGQANVSKHLQLLHATGFVSRRKDGLFVHYGLASKDVFRLCDIMCGRLESEAKARQRAIAPV
ncbi:MAG TPA: metalloregulator ArsR/SmtB family transcription factor [Gemmatimonadaceae bacterium]